MYREMNQRKSWKAQKQQYSEKIKKINVDTTLKTKDLDFLQMLW